MGLIPEADEFADTFGGVGVVETVLVNPQSCGDNVSTNDRSIDDLAAIQGLAGPLILIAGGQGMLYRLGDESVLLKPGAGPAMQVGHIDRQRPHRWPCPDNRNIARN